jgi:hypothetical protein
MTKFERNVVAEYKMREPVKNSIDSLIQLFKILKLNTKELDQLKQSIEDASDIITEKQWDTLVNIIRIGVGFTTAPRAQDFLKTVVERHDTKRDCKTLKLTQGGQTILVEVNVKPAETPGTLTVYTASKEVSPFMRLRTISGKIAPSSYEAEMDPGEADELDKLCRSLPDHIHSFLIVDPHHATCHFIRRVK